MNCKIKGKQPKIFLVLIITILGLLGDGYCQLLYTKSDVIMGMYLFDKCADDPYCRFIYQIDELTHSEMKEFKEYFTNMETHHVQFLTDKDRVGSFNIDTDYNSCTEFLVSSINSVFTEESDEDYNSRYTFIPLIESLKTVTTEGQFVHIKDYVSFSFYASMNDQVRQYEQQYYQDRFNLDKKDAEEKISLYTSVSLLRMKIISPSGFGCKNKQQIPTFIKDENRMVCMMDSSTAINIKKDAGKYKDGNIESSNSDIQYMENDEIHCDDNRLVLTFVILTFITTLALLVSDVWLFVKIHN